MPPRPNTVIDKSLPKYFKYYDIHVYIQGILNYKNVLNYTLIIY